MRKKLIFLSLFSSVLFSALGIWPLSAQAAERFSVEVPSFTPVLSQAVQVPVRVSNQGSDLGEVLVDIEIYNATGQKIKQQYFENQYFGFGQTREFAVSWIPTTTGSYTVKVGIFGRNWSPLYLWVSKAREVIVNYVADANTVTNSVTNLSTNQPVAMASGQVDVWWPVEGAQLSGSHPFKALVKDLPVTKYQMFWQVDGDRLNLMFDNYRDYPHKEVQVDLSGWKWKGAGPYALNFVAKDFAGKTIGERRLDIYTSAATVDNPPPTPTVEVVPAPVPEPAPTPVREDPPYSPPVNQVNSGNPFAGARLYVNPYNEPKQWANANRYTRPYEASLMDKMADQGQVQWFGNWNFNVYHDAKNWIDASVNQGALPVIVAYNIPQRDCGGYSAGGSGSADAYRAWIRTLADAIDNRKTAVILEPDALSLIDCLSAQDKNLRFSLLSEAINILNSKGGVSVYLDAGHPNWIPAEEMANRLKAAGVDKARGFALNVANFFTNNDNINYGEQISRQINGKPFVMETSRNGLGPAPDQQWCNPPGRALGNPPTANSGQALVDAYLWVKGPWGSDGNCNGGPSAGTFWPEYALGLASRASW